MDYKVVPFEASVQRNGSTSDAADQLQSLIDGQTGQGWEYQGLENVSTNVAPTSGCFGLGAQPGYSISVSVAVFKK